MSRLSLLSAPRAAPAPLSAAAPSWLWLLLGCSREGGRGLCRSPQLVTFLTLLPQDERPAAAEGDGPADRAAAGRDRQRAAGKGLRGGGHRGSKHTGALVTGALYQGPSALSCPVERCGGMLEMSDDRNQHQGRRFLPCDGRFGRLGPLL